MGGKGGLDVLDQLIGLYIVCGVFKAHTHTRSFVFGHIQKRERWAKERLRRPELYSVHCTPVAHGGEIHPAKKKINTTAATVEKKEKKRLR